VQLLQKTSKYEQAYDALKQIHQPTRVQKMKLQQLAFFLGVKQYNASDFKQAISFFQESNSYSINNDLSYMSVFWLADCYYQVGDYDAAILHYRNLPLYSNEFVQYYIDLRKYNLAYCYFQAGKYYEANQLFRSYIKGETDSMRLNDTYLRIADGFFMQHEFSLAQQYYDKAKKIDLFDTDYALYNQSICLGLLNKNTRKIHLLNDLVKHYKQSIYYDNALMDLANYHKEHTNYELALSLYDTLLHNNKINVAFRAKAMLSKGMIYFNTNKAEKAIEEFKYVITIYPHYASAKEALSGLQMVYLSIAQVEEYLAFIHNLPGASISRGKQDSLTYHTAFMKFSEGDYVVAKGAFDKYLDNFKDGIFKQDATYYYASSCLQVGDTTTAIKQFALISEYHLKHNEHTSLFLARHYYNQKKYTFSNQYYQEVEQFASTNSLKREAIIRLMYGFDGVEELDIMDRGNPYKYAEKVLTLEKSDDWLKSRATLIVARYQFDVGNYAKSKKTFKQAEKLSEYDEGAEAKYYLAYLTYLDDSLVLAEQLIFELLEQYSSDYFIAKAFILLADIYMDQDNNFQAKATLESVIENHDGADLVNSARKRWELIVESEVLLNTMKEQPQSYIEILEEEIDYDLEEFLIEEVVIDVNYEVVIPDTTNQQTDSLELINENMIKDEIE